MRFGAGRRNRRRRRFLRAGRSGIRRGHRFRLRARRPEMRDRRFPLRCRRRHLGKSHSGLRGWRFLLWRCRAGLVAARADRVIAEGFCGPLRPLCAAGRTGGANRVPHREVACPNRDDAAAVCEAPVPDGHTADSGCGNRRATCDARVSDGDARVSAGDSRVSRCGTPARLQWTAARNAEAPRCMN